MSNKPGLGVVVGRFQTPHLHKGHRGLIEYAFGTSARVVVFVGVAAVKSKRNPLDFAARRAMIQGQYPKAMVVPMPDMPCDKEWSAELDARVEEIRSPLEPVHMIGGRDSFVQVYSGRHKTCKVSDVIEWTTATALRDQVAGSSPDCAGFRRGLISAAYNNWPRVDPVVDVAIIHPDGRLLVGRKKTDGDYYRLIGGFAEGDTYEQDARREAFEETGLEVDGFEYVGSATIDDWRYEGTEHRIRSVLFTASPVFGREKAGDDLDEVFWIMPKDIRMEDVAPSHRPLFKLLQEKGKI